MELAEYEKIIWNDELDVCIWVFDKCVLNWII